MEKIVTCEEMKAMDAYTISRNGMPACVLMERAALAVAEAVLDGAHREVRGLTGAQKEEQALARAQKEERDLTGAREKERVLAVCGSGNNGGDGIAAARILFLKGIRAEIFLVGNPQKMTEQTIQQLQIARACGVPVTNNPKWDEYTTIVDAIFGVGLSRELEGPVRDVIGNMNRSRAYKIAVDIPSGIQGDTGAVLGDAFAANLTVTFAFLKRGLVLYPGRIYAGQVRVSDIGIYENGPVRPSALGMEDEDLRLLPDRTPDGNKGTFGKVLIIGGAKGMCGAAYLCARGALKAGAGMVKIQTAAENRMPLQTLLPEAMISDCFGEEENRRQYAWCDILVAGPGMGTGPEAEQQMYWYLKRAWEDQKPLILDADGLNLLAGHPQWQAYLGSHVIVTPHIGEMSRLTGKSPAQLKNDPLAAATAYARQTGAVCVLKDACTVVCGYPSGEETPGEENAETAAGRKPEMYLNRSGNPGMATAGSGDVLSGVLGAMMCMRRFLIQPRKERQETIPSVTQMAALGVYLHGRAGDFAAEKYGTRGMTAADISQQLPQVLHTKGEQHESLQPN